MSEKENNKEIENIETQISESSNKQETVEKEIIEDIKNEPVTEKENTDSSKITVSQPEEEEHSEILKETPNIDYSQLTELELISELKSIIHSKPVQQIKDTVENIKNEFNLKFQEGLEKNKESFLAEGGNIIDFYYTTPEKKEFDSFYYHYKDKRSTYYKNLQKDQKANLTKREEIIEELKSLFNAKENTSTIYKRFRDIQERWFETGSIPRDKYNTVWNNYHHHVENFYDILHLDREFRDRNFKQNLEHKLRLIGRAEELTKEENNSKAFRELQMLHKMWKEEIGPVAKEFSDDIWEKFSAATKIIHDKRNEYLEEQEKVAEKNVDLKIELINNIASLTETAKNKGHQTWQNTIKKVQELRDQFFESGKVPISKNKEIWNSFKEATRNFNKEKNAFYKGQKKEQFDNLAKKKELIKVAQDNKDGDDFETLTPLMKKIQADWKKIGHVPRKDSDKIWKEFKAICNHYFDRLHSQKDEANKEELANFEAKKTFLESLKSLTLEGDHSKDIAAITSKIKEWKGLGRVPYTKKNIEQDFNKTLDTLFEKLDVDKKQIELIKFENKLNSFVSEEDDRKLKNEEFFISKKVGEIKNEIRQLENNLLFFKHVKDDNPMVKDVHKNISKQKENLNTWIEKLKKVRVIRKG
ncbi:MAG: DUF349 domain-containing protein [Flavobacteriaceae bacterium]|jgi:hypothetical protein|nr:DUF349 domain-containing protein [Flavobacteriaceae bacterium]